MGVGNDIDVPIYKIVGFAQRNQFSQQHQNNVTLYRPSKVNAQAVSGTEKLQDAELFCKYAFDEFSQAHGEIVSCFRQLAEDDLLQPYNTQKDFITSNGYENLLLAIFYMFLILDAMMIFVLLNRKK